MIIEVLSIFLKEARGLDEQPVISGERELKFSDLDKRLRIAGYLFYIMVDETSLRAMYCQQVM